MTGRLTPDRAAPGSRQDRRPAAPANASPASASPASPTPAGELTSALTGAALGSVNGAAPPPIGQAALLDLQRSAGNAAVSGLVRPGGPNGRQPASPATPARPVIQRAMAPEVATRVATQLHDAMDRWGTDEEAIYGALSGRSKSEIEAITTAYQPMAMKGSLNADLEDELTASELARVRGLMASADTEAGMAGDMEQQMGLRAARAQDIARQLDEAMRGLGTDETQLINALTGRQPFQIVEIARAYHDLTGKNLLDEVRSELSGGELEQALAPLRTMFSEGDGPSGQIGLLQSALNATGAATPPLRITGMFGPETTAALSAFQAAHAPLTANGILTLETWLKLDQLAPVVFREGRAVIAGAEGQARGTSTTGTFHPTVRLTNTGAAVEELQKKLLTIPAAQVPTRPTANGTFAASTKQAVKEFQGSRTPPLSPTGVADAATWAALDGAAGPVDVGREEFSWNERVEGSQYGGPTHFTWRLHPDRFEVTVNIRFTGAPNHPMVATWRQQMMNAWNTFKLVDEDHPSTQLPIRFVVGTGSPADATVLVTVTPPGTTPGRSNAGNYHTGDTDPGLGPHEFGHLIGLSDEYNTGPEQYTIITGEQPFVGALDAPKDASGAEVSPAVIAAEIRAAVTSNPANARGTKAQAIVATKYSLAQGAFAQRVAVAYEQANAGNLQREDNGPHGPVIVNDPAAHIEDDIAARIPGRTGPETDATAPFGYSNRSLMGEMQSFNTPVNPHDHPLAERHLRHFADLVGRNRPGNWRIRRL